MGVKKIFKSPLGIGIITTLFGFVLSVGYDMIKGKQFLSTFLTILNSIWKWIIIFLNIELKLWWVLIGIVLLIFVLYIINKIYLHTNKVPSYTNYTNDTIQGWQWEWYWQENFYGKYEIQNLHPVCHSCGTALARKYDSLYCVRCGRTYDGIDFPNINDIKLYIIDTANRGLFKKSEKTTK